MSSGPDENIDSLLQDIARTISENSRFLHDLSSDNIDTDDDVDIDPEALYPSEDEDFEEL